METFDEIFKTLDTDKAFPHSYGRLYDSLFTEEDRWRVHDVLEIGVYRGGSLHGWSRYFRNAYVTGIDINPGSEMSTPTINTHIGDATDPHFLNDVLGEHTYDLIVDDGSHNPRDQLHTLFYLYHRVKPGGYYVIEDLLPDRHFRLLSLYSHLPGVIFDYRDVSQVTSDIAFVVKKEV